MASLYLQSCAGGIFEGDDLWLDVIVDAGGFVHLTSQASTIVHTATSGCSVMTSTFEVRTGAWFEMIADPFILFPASFLRINTRLIVDQSAAAIVADAFLLHDPTGQERSFRGLEAETVIEIRGRGRVACDRYRVAGAMLSAGMPGVTGCFRAQGTLLAISPDGRFTAFANDLSDVLSNIGGLYAGASNLPGNAGVWCRFLASDAVALRGAVDGLWSILRAKSTGRAPQRRRK
jgi:urease accessory protein